MVLQARYHFHCHTN